MNWSASLLLFSLFGSLLTGPATQNSSLPTAKEVVTRYDDALGGRDALMRHTSSTTKGNLESHEGATAVILPFVYFAGAPYLRVEKVTLPKDMGENLNGFDGETADEAEIPRCDCGRPLKPATVRQTPSLAEAMRYPFAGRTLTRGGTSPGRPRSG